MLWPWTGARACVCGCGCALCLHQNERSQDTHTKHTRAGQDREANDVWIKKQKKKENVSMAYLSVVCPGASTGQRVSFLY